MTSSIESLVKTGEYRRLKSLEHALDLMNLARNMNAPADSYDDMLYQSSVTNIESLIELSQISFARSVFQLCAVQDHQMLASQESQSTEGHLEGHIGIP